MYHEQGRDAMKRLQYRILLQKEPEGGYTVTVPTLARARVTFGETVDEAMAREAIELTLKTSRRRVKRSPPGKDYFSSEGRSGRCDVCETGEGGLPLEGGAGEGL
jgi:predicted RNase H-like HicB family nuclease